MQDLPIELVEEIVEHLVSDQDDTAKQVAAVIPNLLLINKHWNDAIRGHRLYSIADFAFFDPDNPYQFFSRKINTDEDLFNWLNDPYRKRFRVQSLRLQIFTPNQLEIIVEMLDRIFPTTTFKSFELFITTRERNECTLQLPKSLATTKLVIEVDWNVDLDWSTFNRQLKDNLENLYINAYHHSNLPRTNCLKKLKTLSVATKFSNDDVVKTISCHPHITALELHEFSGHLLVHIADTISLKHWPNLEFLLVDGVYIDFTGTQLNVLQTLHLKYLDTLSKNRWLDMPRSIEGLTIEGCSDDDFEDATNNVGLFSDLNVWCNLRYLKVTRCYLPHLAHLFQSDALGGALPLIEKISINYLSITRKDFETFVSGHPTLKTVSFNEYSYDSDYLDAASFDQEEEVGDSDSEVEDDVSAESSNNGDGSSERVDFDSPRDSYGGENVYGLSEGSPELGRDEDASEGNLHDNSRSEDVLDSQEASIGLPEAEEDELAFEEDLWHISPRSRGWNDSLSSESGVRTPPPSI